MDQSITPETELERELLTESRLQAGLDWGEARFGHPEGRVRAHVGVMLAAIPSEDPLRNDLRFLALVLLAYRAGRGLVKIGDDVGVARDADHVLGACEPEL